MTLGGLNQAEIEAGLSLLQLHAFELVIVCCNVLREFDVSEARREFRGSRNVWLMNYVSTPRNGHHMPSTKPARTGAQAFE